MLPSMLRRFVFFFALLGCLRAHAQTPAFASADPLQPLDFLLGTWSAKTGAAGSAAATVAGTYTFRRDLAGHVLQRTSAADTCRGPQGFDCNHHDKLTIFTDPNSPQGQSVYALYLDSEGHTIHYAVSTPDAHTVVFTSLGPAAAPHFRLTYTLAGWGPAAVMSGRFEGAAPGASDFHPYLVWSGTRQ